MYLMLFLFTEQRLSDDNEYSCHWTRIKSANES